MEHELARVVALVAFAAVHLFAGGLRFLEGVPRSRWLSAAGGISVAYVFVHVLPELGEGQREVEAATADVLPFLESHVYLLALLGFAVFYGVEVTSQHSRARNADAVGAEGTTTGGVFALSIASFTVYNAVIGYLLAREEFELRGLILFAVGLGLHFVVNDFSLREHHREQYDRVGRFVVVAGIVVGWLLGRATEVSPAAIAAMLAFIAGGVALNVIKEELPRERRSHFGAFALAAGAYAALLIAA